MTQVTVQEVGPIHHVSIDLVPGRVTEITGGNGAGKSTALRAVQTAIEGKTSGLSPRDGRKHGTIEFNGLTCRIGLKMTTRGERASAFAVVDDGQSILQFINPGLKD